MSTENVLGNIGEELRRAVLHHNQRGRETGFHNPISSARRQGNRPGRWRQFWYKYLGRFDRNRFAGEVSQVSLSMS